VLEIAGIRERPLTLSKEGREEGVLVSPLPRDNSSDFMKPVGVFQLSLWLMGCSEIFFSPSPYVPWAQVLFRTAHVQGLLTPPPRCWGPWGTAFIFSEVRGDFFPSYALPIAIGDRLFQNQWSFRALPSPLQFKPTPPQRETDRRFTRPPPPLLPFPA